MSECIGNWFISYTGKKIDPFQMTPDDVCIEDIAHSLSHISRFNGHCAEFYSVAQHSIYVASILPRELKFVGLMHDATEAYCGDMIRPIKVSMPTYRDLELSIWKAICQKFGLPIVLPPEVKAADNSMLMTERRDLMKWTPDDWGVSEQPQEFFIYPRPPRQAEANFLSFFHHWSGVS